MKEEQNKLERRLLEERQEIQRKHQEKVKLARTKLVYELFLLLLLFCSSS